MSAAGPESDVPATDVPATGGAGAVAAATDVATTDLPAATEEIHRLKYRYWRACDAKDAEAFRACFVRSGGSLDFGPLGRWVMRRCHLRPSCSVTRPLDGATVTGAWQS